MKRLNLGAQIKTAFNKMTQAFKTGAGPTAGMGAPSLIAKGFYGRREKKTASTKRK